MTDTATAIRRVALVGNPNSGKTTLFNALTGSRAHTSNFAGTTVEHRTGKLTLDGETIHLLDLPGMYSLKAATLEEKITSQVLRGEHPEQDAPDLLLVVIDACNLERNLFLASQLLELDQPVVLALNMMDEATRHGLQLNASTLAAELGCPVIPVTARSGDGLEPLKETVALLLKSAPADSPIPQKRPTPSCADCGSACPFETRFNWTEDLASKVVENKGIAQEQRTEKLDSFLTHPVVGLLSFLTIMLSVFYLIFSTADWPMTLIETAFGTLAASVGSLLPEGLFNSLVTDGIITGVGGILVFLPQIVILFFFLALLDDSGYLSRAAFVMDRLMRRIGLPGTAFVPLLSAHACALPAIMSTRIIQDRRDRLVTILVAPLMSCSARIPVYAMLVALLFPNSPMKASLAFTGAYALGIVAALVMAFVFGRTILKGETKPLILELPRYKVPSLRMALSTTLDRSMIFVKQAGTIILVISIILWALSTFPRSDAPPEALALQDQATLLAEAEPDQAATLAQQAQNLTKQHNTNQSYAGQIGRAIEPVFRPLGYDWQISIGILSSFAAREVIVSTLSIIYGLGDEIETEEQERDLIGALRRSTHSDGSPVFTVATSCSLLVFYVLAMQCLPTQVVTRRETGSWKWAIFQFVYMSLLAYTAALVTYQVLHRWVG